MERFPQIKPPSQLSSACPFHPWQSLEILARRHFMDAHSTHKRVPVASGGVFDLRPSGSAPHDSMPDLVTGGGITSLQWHP